MAKKKHNKKSKPSLKNKPSKTEFLNLESPLFFWHEYASKYFGPILIIIVAIIMAHWSWGKWSDPMIDFGRELYVPWQILEGSTLYTDIAYFNGPLSPYINSLWFLLLGVHMRSMIIANFIILGIILLVFFKLLEKVDSRIGATVGCLIMITVFAFARYDFVGNYNFIAPYSHEMTHGLLLSSLGIYFFSIYQSQNKMIAVFLSGVLFGLVFLTKAEFTLAVASALISGFTLTFWIQKEPWTQIAIKTACFLTGAFAPPVIIFLLLNTSMPIKQALIGTLGSWPGTLNPELRNIHFYKQIMGIGNLVLNIKTMFIGFSCFLLIFSPAIIISTVNPSRPKRDVLVGTTIGIGIVILSILCINPLIKIVSYIIRPLPLFLICLIIFEGINLWKKYQKEQDLNGVLRLTLLLFSLILLTKILIRVDPHQYGFALAMPGTIILISALVDRIPAFLEKKDRAGTLFRCFSISIIIVFSGMHMFVSDFWYDKSTVRVATDTAKFYTDFRGYPVQEIIEAVEKHSSTDDTLAVLPEGVMLNFLTQRKNPTPYINFMPPEFILFGEQNILEKFNANPPDYIVLTNKPLEEYGLKAVGIDIGVGLYEWVKSNYTLLSYIHPEVESTFPFTQMKLLQYDPLPAPAHQ